MNREDIRQEPWSSTLMSSLKATYDNYGGEPMSDAMMFGLTGHAFVTSVSKGIGPCAPYTWDMEDFDQLCQNSLGISLIGREYPINPKSTKEEKKKASDLIKMLLDKGEMVFLISYEFQLIFKYYDGKFYTTKPWDAPSVTPDFDMETLEGIKDFMLFSKIEKTDRKPLKENIVNSLRFALKQFDIKKRTDMIAQGIDAYDYMLEHLTEESAKGHGIWWNSSVWAESRKKASEYMIELKQHLDQDDVLEDMAKHYNISYVLFTKLADKEVPFEKKQNTINSLKQNELLIKGYLETLLNHLSD